MPAIGVCVLSSIVQGNACSWTPPDIQIEPADTTVLGAMVDLPTTSMWPGESRRIPLPEVKVKRGSRRQVELRGDSGLSFSYDTPVRVYRPVLRSVLIGGAPVPAPSPETAPLPATGMGPPLPAPMTGAPAVCVVRVDSTMETGGTLTAYYAISTVEKPVRSARWRLRILVRTPPTAAAWSARAIAGITAHPNPCNPSTTLSFRLAASVAITLQVFDASGHVVRQIVRRPGAVGAYSISWNGTDARGRPVASGVYMLRLQVGDAALTRKVVLVK